MKTDGGVCRYGKSMADVFAIKKNFFEENAELLNASEEGSKLYRQQKPREKCKICSSKMPQNKYFTNHGTDYYLCEVCGHLNGAYDDNMEYTKELYESGLYGSDYREDDPIKFVKRMDAIYVPKVRFMLDSFNGNGISPESMRYMEIGAGAGYMSCAMDRVGLDVLGIEISQIQVEYANKMAKKTLLQALIAENIAPAIRTTEREVIIFINVLEHIANLNEIFKTIKENKNIKYIYFSVPILSLTCAFEVVFPEIYPRHIGGGGGHTHLFSKQSIDWIFDKYGFDYISTWSFGTDIMDLYRSIVVTLEAKKCHPNMMEKVSKFFQEQTDAIQLIVDKSNFASDVHIIAQVH